MKNNQIPKPKVFLTGLGVFFMLIVLDQITKQRADRIFENHNFAFSLPMPAVLMYGIYFVAICTILIYFYRAYQKLVIFEQLAWMLILAGAMSNVGERTIFGFVRDWVYIYTGVFNLADGYIILGSLILFFYSLMTKTTEMTKLT
jgi:lipoprotein signal peptidase